jgi:hypothetical protein
MFYVYFGQLLIFVKINKIVLAPTTPFTAALQMENQRPHTCPVPGLRILLEH